MLDSPLAGAFFYDVSCYMGVRAPFCAVTAARVDLSKSLA